MLDLPPRLRQQEGGLFLYGAAQPPLLVQEGKFAGRHIFLGIARTGFEAGGWQAFAATLNAITTTRILGFAMAVFGHAAVPFGRARTDIDPYYRVLSVQRAAV